MNGGRVLLQASEGEPLGGAAAVLLHGPCALHEHPAGAAGRVEHRAPVGVEHVGNQRDQGEGGEELAAVVRLLVGEPGEEVLVDAPEDVARDLLQLVGVEGAQELAEHAVVQLLVLRLGQDAAQAVVVCLDGLHGRDDGLGPVLAVGQGDEAIELGLRAQEDSALAREVLLRDRALPAAAGREGSLDLVLHGQIAAVGVAQEHQAHHRQEVLVAGVVGIGAQGVGCLPEALLDRFDVFELRHVYDDSMLTRGLDHFLPDAAIAACSRARSGAQSATCTPPGAKRISRRIHEMSLEYSASRRLWLARFLVQTRV